MTLSWLDLIEGVDLDPSFVDLALWYPALTWQQVAVWFGAMIVWRLVFEPLERLVAFHTRRSLSRGFFRLAVLVKP
jgi:hypothetical protein